MKMSKHSKANQSFDSIVISFCIAGLVACPVVFMSLPAKSCELSESTKQVNERAQFQKCLLDPKCKLSDIKLKTTHKDAKSKLIPPVSIDKPDEKVSQ